MVELPENAVDAAQLIAQNVCSQGKESEFILAGRGGLPENPHQIQNPKVTEVVLVDTVESEPATVSPSFTPVNSYEIVQANGWIFNENGQVVLVAYDRNTREIQGQKHPSGCQPR